MICHKCCFKLIFQQIFDCIWVSIITDVIHTFSAHLMKRAWLPRPQVTEHWTNKQRKEQRRNGENIFILAKNCYIIYILHCWMLYKILWYCCITGLELPLATWRQTTALYVVSGSVWWNRILDWLVSADLSTNRLPVCAYGHLGWCSYTAPSSSLNRCHTYENTAKYTRTW